MLKDKVCKIHMPQVKGFRNGKEMRYMGRGYTKDIL